MLPRLKTDEVIVTGRPEDVSALLVKAAAHGKNVNQKRGMQMQHGGRSLQVGLVQQAAGDRPGSVSDLIYSLGKVARTEQLNVSMEANCTVANPFRQELSPWEWELNPWEWELNPWEWELNPDIPRVVAVGTSPADGAARFWAQPALQTIGLTELGQRRTALATHLGTGVKVGIFDALPTKPVSQPWLTLHSAAVPLEPGDPDSTRDLSDHGLMCASLVNAVAPGAQVHLYEVCTKDGSGSMYPLLDALNAFVDMAAGQPAVISLSLGSICCGSPSPALQAVLQRATDLGMMICAAAGNRGKSASKPCNLGAAQLPAALPNVIAVSASNLTGTRATYSQRGDIAAPGGEDLGPLGPGDPDDIIGMGVSVGTTGYVAMDAGTSFSAPLVAGTAALLVENILAKGGALSDTTYAQVMAALKAGATPVPIAGETLANSGLGAGILNLQGLLV